VNSEFDPSQQGFNITNPARNMRGILLCSTINRQLFFANKNTHWGIGTNFDGNIQRDTMPATDNFSGQNKLGKILMTIRKQLFTSTRPKINKFLEDDGKEPINSTAYLQSSFWEDIK
jgi:hypothetical protein